MVNELKFESRAALFTALTKECVVLLENTIARDQRAGFFVSGGRTPEPLFKSLSEHELKWQSVDIALVDERWVDCDSDMSNERLIRKSLLQKHAAQANFIGMKTHHDTARDAQSEINTRYSIMPEPSDIVLLGMGPDGHTASLFPHSDTIELAMNENAPSVCTAVMAKKSAVTGDITERMSLTLSGILRSRNIFLLITGEDKYAVYQKALVSTDRFGLPVSAVLQQQRIPVTVFWAP